jgi:uncharacterized membrane protein
MKHATLSLGMTLLLLAGCAGRATTGDIVLTRQSRESQDWGRLLPAMYGGVTACLAAHPAQPAYATDAVPQDHGMILVRLKGADNSRYECRTGSSGSPAPKLTPATPQRVAGPAYTPAAMAEPFMRCGTPQPVQTGTGHLLGWLTYFTPDCPPESAAADSGWRAFGNDPYWTLRIAGEDIVFDRLGDVPQRYAVKPPTTSGNRQTWTLEPPSGGDANSRLEVVITETACADSVAARTYPFSAQVTYQGRGYRGCAEKSVAIPTGS